MSRRVYITPGNKLELIPERWQGKFAQMAAELLICEGRSGEVMQLISGLRPENLSGDLK